MIKNMAISCFIFCSQAVAAFASPPSSTTATTLPVDYADSIVQTASSSRQSHSFSYQPYLYGHSSENQPLVRVQINDSVSATFLLDTGSNSSVISNELADRLKLKGGPLLLQGQPSLYEGKPLNSVIVDEIKMGGFKFAKYPLVIFDEKRIALPNQPIDGIIGLDMLQYFDYLFDFPQHKITMFSLAKLTKPADGSQSRYVVGELTPDELKVIGFADAKSTTFRKSTQDGLAYVNVQCHNKGQSGNGDLLLDTGAGNTNISPALAKQLNLSPIKKNIESTTFRGKKFVSTASVDQFVIGNLALDNQPVDYSSQRAYDKNVPLSFGMDIISKYQVLMDFQNQKIYFRSNTPTAPAVTIGPTPAAPAAPSK